MFVSMSAGAMFWHSVGIFAAGLLIGGLAVYGISKVAKAA